MVEGRLSIQDTLILFAYIHAILAFNGACLCSFERTGACEYYSSIGDLRYCDSACAVLPSISGDFIGVSEVLLGYSLPDIGQL